MTTPDTPGHELHPDPLTLQSTDAQQALFQPQLEPRPEFPDQAPRPEPAPASAPSPGRAPLAAPVSPLTRYLGLSFTRHGLQTLGMVAGVVLLSGLIGAGMLLGSVSAEANSAAMDLGQVLGSLLIGTGVTLGGGISLDAHAAGGFLSATGSAHLSVLPMGVTAVVVAGVVLVSRFRLRRESVIAPTTGAEALRAAIEAGIVALLVTLLTAFARMEGLFSLGEMRLSSRAGLVLLAVFCTVSIALFIARGSARRRATGTPAGAVVTGLRETGVFLAVVLSCFAIAAIVALVIATVQSGEPTMFFGGLLLLGNLAVAGASLGYLGGVHVDLGWMYVGTGTVFDMPNGFGFALIAVALLAMATAAGAVGVRRVRTSQPNWRRVWQMPVIVCVIWAVGALGFVGIAAGGSLMSMFNLGVEGRVGLAWWSPLTVGGAAAVVSIAAEFAPQIAYRINPKLLVAFGGVRGAREWIAGAPTPAPVANWTRELAPQTAEAPNDLAPRLPMRPQTKRTLIVVGSVAGVLLVIGTASAATIGVLNQQRDPSHTVRQYLDLIANGEAAAANDMVDPGLRTAQRALLTDEVLQAAEQRIEVVDVKTTARSSDGASVHATMSLDGERFEVDFAVTPGAKEFGVLDTWSLSDSLLVPVSISSDGLETVMVGDTELTLDRAEYGSTSSSSDLFAYPGMYAVTGMPSEYIESSTETLRASPTTGLFDVSSASITAEPTEKFSEKVLEQVQERMAACVEAPTNMDKVCPSATRDTELDEMNLVTQITQFDYLSLAEFETEYGTISVREKPSEYIKSPRLREVDVSMYGEIVFENGVPVVEGISSYGW